MTDVAATEVVVVAGMPGIGKTSALKELRKLLPGNWLFVDSDILFTPGFRKAMSVASGIPMSTPEFRQRVSSHARDARFRFIRDVLNQGINVLTIDTPSSVCSAAWPRDFKAVVCMELDCGSEEATCQEMLRRIRERGEKDPDYREIDARKLAQPERFGNEVQKARALVRERGIPVVTIAKDDSPRQAAEKLLSMINSANSDGGKEENFVPSWLPGWYVSCSRK